MEAPEQTIQPPVAVSNPELRERVNPGTTLSDPGIGKNKDLTDKTLITQITEEKGAGIGDQNDVETEQIQTNGKAELPEGKTQMIVTEIEKQDAPIENVDGQIPDHELEQQIPQIGDKMESISSEQSDDLSTNSPPDSPVRSNTNLGKEVDQVESKDVEILNINAEASDSSELLSSSEIKDVGKIQDQKQDNNDMLNVSENSDKPSEDISPQSPHATEHSTEDAAKEKQALSQQNATGSPEEEETELPQQDVKEPPKETENSILPASGDAEPSLPAASVASNEASDEVEDTALPSEKEQEDPAAKEPLRDADSAQIVQQVVEDIPSAPEPAEAKDDSSEATSVLHTPKTEDKKVTDESSPAPLAYEPKPDQSPEEAEEKKEEDKWTHVLGHDKLKKKTIVPGKGIMTRPTHGQVATVRYVGKLFDSDREVERHDAFSFVLGDGDIIQALDLSIALMQLEETAEIVTEAQYAYGRLGREPEIPGDAKLKYEVTLLKVDPSPDYAKMPISQRTEEGDKKREKGNWFYSRGEHTAAINAYTKALKILDNSKDDQTEEAGGLQKLLEMRLKCYNNLAAAQIKVEAWEAAIKSCDEVLKVQPENVKALFRKGKCFAGKDDVDTAIVILKKALKLEPETKIIHQELGRLVSQQKLRQQSEKNLYKKMLGTKDAKEKPAKKDSRWLMYFGAGAAAFLAMGLAAYRYVHT